MRQIAAQSALADPKVTACARTSLTQAASPLRRCAEVQFARPSPPPAFAGAGFAGTSFLKL